MPREWWTSPDVTPFARRLRDYMVPEQLAAGRPSLTVAALARQLRAVDPAGAGVSPPTIWDWLRKGARPHPRALELLHHATGIARDEWYALAGRQPPAARRAQHKGGVARAVKAEVGEEVWDFIWTTVGQRLDAAGVSEGERQAIFGHLGEVRRAWRRHISE